MTSVHDVDRAMQTVLDSHLDEHARALTAAWAAGWEDVKARLEAALLDTTPDRRARIAAAVDAMAATLADLTGETKTRILGSLDDVVALGVQGEAVMASTSLGYRVQVARADPAQVRAIIDRTTGQITATTDSIGPDAEAAIRRRLVSGVALGDHPNDVAASAVRDVDGHFNGGLTRALNISRTEMADAMRAGQKATDLANPGIITGWVWTAHLDSRTCQACVGKHGTVYPPDEDGPNDHHSGRCARVPMTVSWAALGIVGVPEPDLGAVDADAWVDGLDDSALASLLGRRGADAYRAGEFPRDRWAETRSNPGWRDSIAPARAPK